MGRKKMIEEENIKNKINDEGQFEVDTKILSSTIIELNISRKNISFYPMEHPIIKKAVNRAYDMMQKIFETTDKISLGISKDTLIMGQSYLDKNNPVYRDFAKAMNEKMITSITFRNGISIDELSRFLAVTSLSNDEINEKGGMSKIFERENISYVTVTELDYDAFQLESEEEISKKDKTRDETSKGLWDSFVYNLMGDSLEISQDSQKAKSKTEMVKVDPKMLAKMISESKHEKVKEEHKYDETIAEYLRNVNKKEGVSEDERKKLIKDVANFTNDLSSDLRKQLLSSTFKSNNVNSKDIKDFISDLSKETILETLHDVNKKKLKIPHTILNLLEKFSTVDKKDMKLDEKAAKKTGEIEHDKLKNNIGALLSKDHQLDYTPDEYQASLDHFVKKRNVAEIKKLFPKEFDELIKSFSDEYIELRYVTVLIEIIKKEKDTEALKKLLNRLFENSLFLIETGQYECAAKIWSLLVSVSKSQEHSQEYREIALNKLDDIKEMKITDELISGLKQYGKEKFESIKEIILMFQDVSLTPLLKELCLEQNAYYRKLYMNIISLMDKKVCVDLVKHINDKRWYFVRNIIVLLRNLKGYEYLDKIKKSYNHENKVVKAEVIKTILDFKDDSSADILKEGINDEDKDFSNTCIMLAGSYQVNELTPLLLSKITKIKKVYFESDLKDKKILIQALAEMGDKKALPYFKNIMNSSSYFIQGKIKELKLQLLNNLHRFDYEDIEELVEIGLKSNDEEIIKAAKQLQ
jgi:hypothetical protein